MTYVAHIVLSHVIYENVDIVFIGIYNKQLLYPLSILNVIFLKSNSFRLKESLIRSITNNNGFINQEMMTEFTFNQTKFLCPRDEESGGHINLPLYVRI